MPKIVSSAEIEPTRARFAGKVLAEVHYSRTAGHAAGVVTVPMRQVAADGAEFWIGEGERLTDGECGSVRFRCDGRTLFGALPLPDSSAEEFETVVACAYTELLACIVEQGYPHLHRVWNYFPHIHETCNGLDRYQAFCRGRHAPLARHCRRFDDGFPAATAIGSRGAPGRVFFLAATEAGYHQENPRQVSAYQYPSRYGPQSPSFARATVTPGAAPLVLVSGTASIVGHESRHPEDIAGQFDEAWRNVDEVLAAARRERGGAEAAGLRLEAIKIYLRHPDTWPELAPRVADQAGSTPCLVIEGELCRRELLLEIEAVASLGRRR